MVVFLSGVALGLALITPIGAQNVFVLGQGVAAGLPRALWTAAAAATCDTLLILAGAGGVSALLGVVPGLRVVLLAGGVVFLCHLGVQSLRSKPDAGGELAADATAFSTRRVVTRTVAVSLLNPHAILDTVGVLGAAIAAQPESGRVAFGAGAVTASWLWFAVLAVGAALLRRYLTPDRRVWFDRISGGVMLAFAVLLTAELTRAVLS
ncbi:LysE/ArgO family amino acid transporter [Longispora albida]|uniref:LysE/ArgO family amino acid transporter n=1 Tax=Longispora albida TaxID=203523 RepID=UPI000381A78E|nr:LysE family transporter [Longispora albida]